VNVVKSAPVFLRRARGSVPQAIETGRPFAEPLLACGAHLKNTFCLAAGTSAFLGPHIGDLESVDTLRAYEAAIEQLKQFTSIEPRVIAHDMHPDYFSTRYAQSLNAAQTIAVQHHHAHIASVMAEHHLDERVIGIAYDGTGFGTDGTSWGGEILLADFASFTRFATFRAIPLAGGDQAIRQPWRVALAMLDDAFDGLPPLHALPLFRDFDRAAVDAIRRMIARKFNSPLARGLGRTFDAFGALFLGMPDARYEGELAFRWNVIADANEQGHYPIVIRDGTSPMEIDPRPMTKAAVDDFLRGVPPSIISARFHNTIAAATIEIARAALATHGDMPVVLSGGCFQNVRLAESIIDGLAPVARVFINRHVPPGDGGIALGQAFVANAIVQRGITASATTNEVLACV